MKISASEVEITSIDEITLDFWKAFVKRKIQTIALSIDKVELDSEFLLTIFPQMQTLQRLSLSAFCNTPAILQTLDLSTLDKLKELEISNVNLQYLPRGISGLSHLQCLSLSNLPIKKLAEMPDKKASQGGVPRVEEIYGILKQLKILNISHAELTALPAFSEPLQLQQLRVSSIGISRLPNCYYTTDLEVLELPNSHIQELNPVAFMRMEKLRILDVSFSMIRELPPRAACQHTLRKLNLRGLPNLKRLPVWVAECDNLEKLNLAQDQLDEFPTGILQKRNCQFYEDVDGSHSANRKRSKYTCIYIGGLRQNTIDTKLLLTNHAPLLKGYVAARNKRPICRGNLILMGDLGVGKTTLAEMLTGIALSEWQDCFGIRLLDDQLAFENIVSQSGLSRQQRPKDHIKVRFMHMSGTLSAQLIHPLFLTNHSLYLIVLDGTQEQMQTRALYWARIVESYAPNGHIVFVVWSDVVAGQGLSLPLLRQNVWMERDPEVVYLTRSEGEKSPDCTRLCQTIVEGILSLMLAVLPFPESWIQLLSHFERLLESRLALQQDIFDQLLERYVTQEKLRDNEQKYLQKYLLTFEQETVGQTARVLSQTGSAQLVFYQTGWLSEGLYRLSEYAWIHGGVVSSPHALWEYLIDSAFHGYSLAHAEQLLQFCVEQNLCYATEYRRRYVFPGLSSELYREVLPEDDSKGLPLLIHAPFSSNTTEHYLVRCPLLSRTMISQMSVILRQKYTPTEKMTFLSGQDGFFLRVPKSGTALLVLGSVGASVELHIYFWANSQSSEAANQLTALIHSTFQAFREVLRPLPTYFANQYEMCLERTVGNSEDPRFTQKAIISFEEISGYLSAGRDTYFNGVLNRTYEIQSFENLLSYDL